MAAARSAPLGSNTTTRGRALNRRVEVEFWYDDPLQELSDEPQLCPEDSAAVTVTKVYDPTWGEIPVIDFSDGQPGPARRLRSAARTALADVADKTNARLRFIGYTRNERLSGVPLQCTATTSSCRRRARDARWSRWPVTCSSNPDRWSLRVAATCISDDVVNAGFIQGETSHVAVQVVYDELAILDDYEGVDITRLTPRN